MIQPNELRIGDIFYFKGELTAITHAYLYEFVKGNVHLVPVELTPDILEAAGCKKDVIDGWNLWVNGNLFVIRKLVSSNGYTISVGNYCLCDMEYLHTFQNAYYCLTGDELQIDITKLNK